MANLLARFQMVDEMSSRLEQLAQRGQAVLESFERLGDAGTAAFGGIERGASSAVTTADGVAHSLSDLAGTTGNAASRTDALAESMSRYGDAAGIAVTHTDDWADSVEDYEKSATGAAEAAESLADAGEKSAEALKEQERRFDECELSAQALSRTIDGAADTHKSLSEAMERASRTASELADNENVSTEAKEELARAAENAEDAMRGLEDAQNEAVAAMENYDAVLASGADNMDELEAAAERNRQASEKLAEADAKAADAAKELSEATDKAADEAERSSQRGQDAAQKLANVLAAAGIAALINAIKDAFLEASNAAAAFEVGIAKVSTIADTSRISLGEIESQISALSRETGQSVSGLSEAVYSAISASVDTASAVEFTGTATKLAAGGFTAAATAVDVLTTALNAYGLEAGEAENISDMLITTQNLGKTSVDELASSVGKVIPLAAAYGVEMDNLSAAYAELTKGGIATAEAGTYLKSMLNELGDSGSTVSATLIEKTGYSFAQLTKQGRSLGDVMAILGESVNGDAGAFNELWSSSEAGIGALSLYNAGAQQFNTTLDAMRTSAGATQSAYDAMTDTVQHSQEELSIASENLNIAVGQSLNPLIQTLYEGGTAVLNVMTEFASEHPVAVKALAAIAIGIGAVTAAISTATGIAAAASATVIPFLTGIAAAMGPVGLLIAGITAAGVAIGAFAAMAGDASDETLAMTATTRKQYLELQDLNSQYEEACAKYGETSDEASALKWQIDDLTAALEANGKTVSQLASECDGVIEKHNQLIGSTNSAAQAVKGEEVQNLALIAKLEAMASAANISAESQRVMEGVIKELNGNIDGLNLSYDDLINNQEEAVASLKQYARAQAEQALQEAKVAEYVDYIKQQAEEQAKLAEVEEELAAAAERVAAANAAAQGAGTITGGVDPKAMAELNAAVEAQNTLTEKQAELQAALDETTAHIEGIEAAWEKAVSVDKFSAALENAGYSMKDMQTRLQGLGVSTAEFQNALSRADGDADKFADALYEACQAGTTFEDVEKALGVGLEELGKIMDSAFSFSVERFSSAMEKAGYSLEDMRGRFEGLGVSSEEFADILSASKGDADDFADALYEACNAGTSFEDVERALGVSLEELGQIMDSASEQTISYGQAAATAFQGVQQDIEKLCADYDEAYKAAQESFEGQFGLFDKASTKSEEYVNSTVANAQKALDSQLKYWDGYLANVEKLKAVSAEDLGITQENYEALMAYVQDGSEEAAGLAQSMVNQINAGNEEAVAKLANTVGAVQAKQAEASASVAEWQTNFNATMSQLEERMNEAVTKMNLSGEAEASAKATISSYAQAIRNGEAEATTAAKAVADRVAATLAANPVTVNVKVNQVPGTTLPAHADGTTNAESAFIAGEEGPELIARKADAYAAGTTDSSNYYIAGENGPELIVGQQGSTVFPHEETEKIIRELGEPGQTETYQDSRTYSTAYYYGDENHYASYNETESATDERVFRSLLAFFERLQDVSEELLSSLRGIPAETTNTVENVFNEDALQTFMNSTLEEAGDDITTTYERNYDTDYSFGTDSHAVTNPDDHSVTFQNNYGADTVLTSLLNRLIGERFGGTRTAGSPEAPETVSPSVIAIPAGDAGEIRETNRETERVFQTNSAERMMEKTVERGESVSKETTAFNRLMSLTERVFLSGGQEYHAASEIPMASSAGQTASAFSSETESVTEKLSERLEKSAERFAQTDASTLMPQISQAVITLIPAIIPQILERFAERLSSSDFIQTRESLIQTRTEEGAHSAEKSGDVYYDANGDTETLIQSATEDYRPSYQTFWKTEELAREAAPETAEQNVAEFSTNYGNKSLFYRNTAVDDSTNITLNSGELARIVSAQRTAEQPLILTETERERYERLMSSAQVPFPIEAESQTEALPPVSELAASATEYHTGNVSGYFSPTFIAQDNGNVWQNERRNAYETNSVLSANSETITNWLSSAATRTEAPVTPPDVSETSEGSAFITNNAPVTAEYVSQSVRQESRYPSELGETLITLPKAQPSEPPAFAPQSGVEIYREIRDKRISDYEDNGESGNATGIKDRRPAPTRASLSGATRGGEQVMRHILEIVGKGSIDIGHSNKDEVITVLQAYLKPFLMSLLRSDVFEEGDSSYDY